MYDVSDRPALALVEMALTMTIPMVACMRFRGHGWRLCNEMAASMLILALGALALLSGGLVTDTAALGIEHMAMLPSMLRSVMTGGSRVLLRTSREWDATYRGSSIAGSGECRSGR